jgi:DNA-binding XRE family transcriptional regulator
MTKRASWEDLKAQTQLTPAGQAAYDDEWRVAAFRAFVYRLRNDAGLTQAQLAERMGTTQSAIARMEGGAVRPTLERLARAIGPHCRSRPRPLPDGRIHNLHRSGHAVLLVAS